MKRVTVPSVILRTLKTQNRIAAASGKKVCPVCDASNSSDSLYCKKCGTSLDFNNTYTVNKYSATNYLFNNPRFVIISTVKGSGKVVQTEEIYVPRSSKLYTAEKQGRKYVLIEK